MKGNVVIHTSNPHILSSSAIKLMGRGSIALLHPRDGVWEHTKLQKEWSKVCVSGENNQFQLASNTSDSHRHKCACLFCFFFFPNCQENIIIHPYFSACFIDCIVLARHIIDFTEQRQSITFKKVSSKSKKKIKSVILTAGHAERAKIRNDRRVIHNLVKKLENNLFFFFFFRQNNIITCLVLL